MRILLDTNVWISAFWFAGVCREVFNSASERVVLITSEALISEVKANRQKFLEFMGVTDLKQISVRDYKSAVAALERKRQKPE